MVARRQLEPASNSLDKELEELFSHDQDHYGGLAANDVLAERAGIGEGSRVVDLCRCRFRKLDSSIAMV
jgi:hypothetical protein